MSNKNLASNIGQAVHDFSDVKDALIEKGISLPSGTKTEQYGDLIRSLYSKPYVDEMVEAARLTLLKSIYEGGEIGAECSPFTGKLNNGDYLFRNNQIITGFTANLSNLKSGRYMFNLAQLQTLIVQVPELEDGTYMFNYMKPIQTFSVPGGFPKLKIADYMFEYNPADVFEFPALESGIGMYNSTDLTVDQMLSILHSIPNRNGLSKATLTLNKFNKARLTAAQIAIGTNKNWDIAD